MMLDKLENELYVEDEGGLSLCMSCRISVMCCT